MGEFGWAYVSGSQIPDGLDGSLQYKGGNDITGSTNLVFDNASNTLVLSGTLNVSGAINANELNINVTNKSVTNISATGSTTFGDTTDDTHNFTGIVNLTAAADSALVYLSGSTYLTSSNSTHLGLINAALPTDVSFVKAVNPALVVSGAAVFNDPVSIQGGLYGASPIDIYAPLRYKAANDADDLLIQRGKFIGRVEISSSNAEHGLFMEGAARIKATTTQADNSDLKPELQFINDAVSQTTYPIIDLRKYNSVGFADHPQLGGANKTRKHDQYTLGDIQWATQLPILTGSDSSSLDQYQMTTFKASRITTTVDARRNAYQINFLTTHTNFDPEYEVAHAADDASLTSVSGALEYPFTSSDFNSDPNKTINSLIVGSFSAPGQGNIYGLKRGIMVGGNILPMGADLRTFGGGIEHLSHHGTIGHPVARWGDMYMHDDRYIRWGQTAGDGAGDAYKRFVNSNPLTASARIDSGSVIFGYNSSSAFLEVSGATAYLNDGLNITSSGYVNFGLTKGVSGYGLRDNTGSVQFKHNSGEWRNIDSIGEAEDVGTPTGYVDGLFDELATTTNVGTVIDRFNEVFKIIAPPACPKLNRISYEAPLAVSAKLSFDASNPITDYTASSNQAGFTAVDRNDPYTVGTTGSHFRIGVYDGTQEITGTINFLTPPNSVNGFLNYASGAFAKGGEGSLKLELNGTTIHTTDLASFIGAGATGTGSANSLTNGSGFVNVSLSGSSFDGNGAEWYIFQHRTTKYKIEANEQKTGLNYLRVVHTVGATNYNSNYVEWINDPDGAALALAVVNPRIENIVLQGSKYLSGVQYNTGITGSYRADITNMYRNVYPSTTNTITFSPSNANSITAQSVSPLSGGDDETKVTGITGSLVYNSTYLLNGTISTTLSATHPLKTNLSNTGVASMTGMLIDNSASTNSNLVETFEDEDFRITSGSYDTQGSVVAGAATWNSQNHMTASGATGHEDGMLFYNRRVYNPRDGDIAGTGNFTSLANVSAGQPDYSSITGTRTFYRKIQNDSGAIIRDMKITSQKNGFKFMDDATGLDDNDSHFYVKIPGSTGWMNIRESFSFGSTSDGDGALVANANDNSSVTGTGNSVNCITFGTQSVADDEYVVMKIETNYQMAGYVSQLDLQLGASDVSAPTESALLDDIDLDDTAGVTTKLSFGTSNGVTGYTNVAGGIGSMGAVNSNATYTDNADTNRGVFKTIEVMGGTLNEDVSQSTAGSFLNYTANSFKNAHTGSLLMIINDTTASTLSLSNLTSNNNLSSDTGFSVGAVDYSTTTDGIPDYTKSYRTGTFSIGTAQQRSGWNYARVLHRIGASDTVTNYVQWVIDTSGAVDNTAVTTPTLSDFGHTDVYYQSGIKYYASNPTASFDFEASNFYSNVHSNESNAISFPTTTNCQVTNIRVVGSGITTFNSGVSQTSMPSLDNSADCETTIVQVTGTLQYDGATPSIYGSLSTFTDQDVAANATVLHPLKTDRTTSTASKANLMVYSGSIGSTNLNTEEYFNTEDYRIVSGSYTNQADITSSAQTWNSQTEIDNGGTHDDGMVTAAGYVLSPFKIGVSGDTGHASLQTPAGNPDYSSLTSNTRTLYRQFKNNSGALKQNGLSISFYGDANLLAKSGPSRTGTLGANDNIFVEIKVSNDPNYTGGSDLSTGWMDAIKSWDDTEDASIDGAGLAHGSVTQTVSSESPSTVNLEFQTKGIYNNQYFVVKISAHKDWTGYLSRIRMAY
tara:strand:+ start:130 stop:5331 length:5202 start_codon:yes stop_codon:yes gene_type:complete